MFIVEKIEVSVSDMLARYFGKNNREFDFFIYDEEIVYFWLMLDLKDSLFLAIFSEGCILQQLLIFFDKIMIILKDDCLILQSRGLYKTEY